VVTQTLALGTGMTTAIFSVVNAALLRPLGYPNAERLVWLEDYDSFLKHSMIDLADFREWRVRARSYTAMAAYTYDQAAIATTAEASNGGINGAKAHV
jgi:putative ABC transport system permease protein